VSRLTAQTELCPGSPRRFRPTNPRSTQKVGDHCWRRRADAVRHGITDASGKAIDRVRDLVPVTGYRLSLSPTRSTRTAARLDNDRLRQIHHRNGCAIARK
jgi:hypothetical protein